MTKKIILAANSCWYFYNFRKNLINKLILQNYEIILIATKDEYFNDLKKLKLKIYAVNFKNRFFNIPDILIILNLFFLFMKEKPNFFIGFTIKPNIYGLFAGFFFKIKFINTITGLGTFYLKTGIQKKIISYLYKLFLKKSDYVIFQNKDDLNYFKSKNLLNNKRAILIKGSGVDLRKFKFTLKKCDNNNISFYFIGRMLADKGISELIEAIDKIKKEYKNIKFNFVGSLDPNNYSSINIKQIKSWEGMNLIKYHGFKRNIYDEIKKSDCIILPSYREGLSKILIEACAVGRPAITTNVAGCKDVITDQVNGFLCKPRDPYSLYLAIKKYIDLPIDKKIDFSYKSHDLVKKNFSDEFINKQYMELLNKSS